MIDNWTWLEHKRWWGYTDIGRVQLPPNPQYLILTDRATGTLYWVQWTGSAVAITTTLPCNPPIDRPTKSQSDPGPFVYNNCAVYDALTEPVIGQADSATLTRICIINGVLQQASEKFLGQYGVFNAAPVYVIPKVLGFGKTFAQITAGVGTFTVTTFTLKQTPNPPPLVSNPPFSNTVDV